MLAGCGVLDAHNIRTNCCALVSLLASAVLATAPATTAAGTSGIEGAELFASAGAEENILPEGHANNSGGATHSDGQEVGGSGWGTFVPMGAKPSPDVVYLIRKKGWAARQQQLQRPAQSTAAGTAAGASLRSRAAGTHGRVKKQPRRSRQKAKGSGGADSSGPDLQTSTESGATERSRNDFAAAGSPGKRLSEQHETLTALTLTPSNSANYGNRRGRGIGTTGDRAPVRKDALSWREERQENARTEPRLSRHHLPMSDCLASPPRISRDREGRIPAAPSGLSFPSALLHDDGVPLGLSTSGRGNQKSTAKVGRRTGWAKPEHLDLWVRPLGLSEHVAPLTHRLQRCMWVSRSRVDATFALILCTEYFNVATHREFNALYCVVGVALGVSFKANKQGRKMEGRTIAPCHYPRGRRNVGEVHNPTSRKASCDFWIGSRA